MAQVSCGGVKIAGDDVPPNSPTGKVVDCTQSSGKVIRLLISRGNGDAKPNAPSGCCHGRHCGQGLIDGPLRSRNHGRVRVTRALIDVVCALVNELVMFTEQQMPLLNSQERRQ